MTVSNYIKGRFAKFGLLQLDEADLSLICRENFLDPEASDTDYTITQLETAVVSFCPDLLLCIDSISENGFSISKANTKESIMAFYNAKCAQYNIENRMTGISDQSDSW